MPHFRKLSEFGKGIPNFIFDVIGRFDIILGDETPDFDMSSRTSGRTLKLGFMTLLQELSLSPLDILSNLLRSQLFDTAGFELVIPLLQHLSHVGQFVEITIDDFFENLRLVTTRFRSEVSNFRFLVRFDLKAHIF